MNSFKSHFVLDPSQRNGIFLLLIIILILVGVFFFYPFKNDAVELTAKEKKQIRRFRHKIDSLKKIKQQEEKYVIYPFNPNYISDFEGYKLGMSVEEIDRLHAYREKGKWINSKADFQRVTKVSDSLLSKISPYFDFPDWVTEQIQNEYKNYEEDNKKELPFHLKKDLNVATAEDLIKIRGIGEVLSQRIVRYRKKIGGFVNDIQLKDVYGLDYEVTQRLLNKFTVKDTNSVEKVEVNSASIVKLLEVPYFDYELARKIRNYRLLHEGFKNFGELMKVEGFPVYKIDRIKLYLTLEKPSSKNNSKKPKSRRTG